MRFILFILFCVFQFGFVTFCKRSAMKKALEAGGVEIGMRFCDL